ncbi:MAG: peptide chain release factor N(5)-glutamine methyltransferase [Caldilineaceae bacterium]|nr:peptide chain release factor N(5)-glutamine methyltransferase [Caldilineaceae bacterium]MBP8110651.1 peptide chain release factor N(5)-glutamine methyltransferase [Caldilineaceae bacterium]MBP8125513.1 peptide chain release factor N(5)-glutamine methyltransferase [Caldilineaceae bacterium]MBP9073611.1 peptide chain release factor N(5)-glutamine methyltransferase [Caldilineaceae bacterium]
MQIRHALAQAVHALSATHGESPRLDAHLLLAHLLGVDRAWLFAHDDHLLPPETAQAFTDLVARRLAHTPVAYLTGHRDFFGLSFHVDPRVLIPRPETELLVEAVLDFVKSHPSVSSVADVGTGSGIIGVTLGVQAPGLVIYAVDASADALAVAQANAAALLPAQARPITFLHGDLLAPLPGPVDIIAANLPYIPAAAYATLQPNVRDHEPAAALLSGVDGLDHIRRLLAAAPAFLRPHGAIFLEIGHDQGASVQALAQALIPGCQVHLTQDLAGLDRLVKIWC